MGFMNFSCPFVQQDDYLERHFEERYLCVGVLSDVALQLGHQFCHSMTFASLMNGAKRVANCSSSSVM